jgi:hypothetical protein
MAGEQTTKGVTTLVRSEDRYPRLNLARGRIVHLSFRVDLDWTDQRRLALKGLLDNQRHFLSGTVYRRDRRKHVITAESSVSDEHERSIRLSVSFDAGPQVRSWSVPASSDREVEWLQHIQRLEGEQIVDCSASFEFDDVPAEDLWFPLPARLGGDGSEPALFEIRGVSGVKMAEDNPDNVEYSFSMGRSPEGFIVLRVAFFVQSPFDRQLPKRILDLAVDMARQFVRRS